MDVSELRKRIVRALDDARKDAAARRTAVDDATQAFDEFLQDVAVPLLRQSAVILKSEGHLFTVHTPAGSARLASDKTPETFLEVALDTGPAVPHAIGRISLARGRSGRVEERAIAAGKPVRDLTEEDLAQFLVRELPKLIVRS